MTIPIFFSDLKLSLVLKDKAWFKGMTERGILDGNAQVVGFFVLLVHSFASADLICLRLLV